MLRSLLGASALLLLSSIGNADVPASAPAATGQIPIEDFFKHPQFTQAVLSPDGHYLAVVGTGKSEEDGVLAFIDLSTMKAVGSHDLVGEQRVASITWISDTRVVFTLATQTGSLDQPVLTGDIWAMNVDGTGVKTLAYHLGEGIAFRYHYNELLYASHNNPKSVMIAEYDGSANPVIYRVDTRTAEKHQVLISPLNNGDVIADNNGDARIAYGVNTKTVKDVLLYREPGSVDWKDLTSLVAGEPSYTSVGPLMFAPDDESFYFKGMTDKGKLGLYLVDPKTMKKTLIYGDDDYDIQNDFSPTYWLKGGDDRTLVAFQYSGDMPSWILLNKDLPEAKILQDVSGAFNGENVVITSFTQDAAFALLYVFSDRDPGGYFLYDAKQKQARPLFNSSPQIDPEKMAEMKPIVFKARDGLTIHGYLTLPPGREKNLPLVIHPHGGPFTIRDFWGYDPEVQFLANRGYAVLQVNYRGSGGYGAAFQEAGYREWGGKMQDDLTDATKWAIQQGIADANRICIYGGSYGGYASLEGVVKEPDLYKCAVGYAGVYDLIMLRGRADTIAGEMLTPFMKSTLGDDEAALKEHSPVFHVDKIKAALFLAHGGHDTTVPIAHAEDLKDALDKINKPYGWLTYPNEAHGFYATAHNVAFYSQMSEFFDKYIGPDAAKTAPAKP
jgi:dipeptidyl aminopeptidase/acylaminoacyl peptidase